MEVRALLDLGDVAKATRKLDDLSERVGWRWRLTWFRAVSELLTADYDSATKHFTEVLDHLPGELAPKLALAATAELASSTAEEQFYRTVWWTDDSVISAGFGLARARSAVGERRAAVRTLDEVPPTSRHFTTARLTSAVTLAVGPVDQRGDRGAAARRGPSGRDAAEHRAPGAAVAGPGAGHGVGLDRRSQASTNHILGFPFTQHGLQLGVEASLRALARVAPPRHIATRWWTWPIRAADEHVLSCGAAHATGATCGTLADGGGRRVWDELPRG